MLLEHVVFQECGSCALKITKMYYLKKEVVFF